MLEPWIIDWLRRQEEARQRAEEESRRLYLPLPEPPRRERPEDPEPGSCVIVIEFS